MTKGIAVAGTIAVDEIKAIERYPEKSELTTIKSVQKSIGGAVSNCSVGLAKIDKTLLIEPIALLGDDERGRFLYDSLSHYKNINLQHLGFLGETPFTDVIQDLSDKTRTFFTFKGNSTLFDESSIHLTKLNAKILHVAYILLLDALDEEDSKYGTKMAKLLKKAQELGIKTSIDIVSENNNRYGKIVPPSLRYTNYCVINEYEAGKSVGVELRDENGGLIASKVREVLIKLKDFGVEDWVVIHSPEASFGYDGTTVHSIPSLLLEKERIKGTVGAGDAYLSGLLYGAYKELSLIDSMQIATAAAATSLFEEDSTSGIQSYPELMNLYKNYKKREKINI